MCTTMLVSTTLLPTISTTIIGIVNMPTASAFHVPTSYHSLNAQGFDRLATSCSAVKDGQRNDRPSSSSKGRRPKKESFTIADLREEILKSPSKFIKEEPGRSKKRKSRRTRQRVDEPKQQYLYKAQRERLIREGKLAPEQLEKSNGEDGESVTDPKALQLQRAKYLEEMDPIAQARNLGLMPANQHCDPPVDPNDKPYMLGQIRVSEGNGSAAYAYLIEKPAGWAILGNSGQAKMQAAATQSSSADSKTSTESTASTLTSTSESTTPSIKSKSNNKDKNKSSFPSRKRKVSIVQKDGKMGSLEFDEADVLSMMTPQERKEWEAQGTELFKNLGPATDDVDDDDGDDYDDTAMYATLYDGYNQIESMTAEQREEAGIEDEDYDPNDVVEFDEADVLAAMTEEERAELGLGNLNAKSSPRRKSAAKASASQDNGKPNNADASKPKSSHEKERNDPTTLENLKRIEARQESQSRDASFTSPPRPSVVAWLKEMKAEEGIPIKGGKFWTAVAGATNVDDSGIVLLCPKSEVANVFVDYADYVAVVGNGKYLVNTAKQSNAGGSDIPKESVEFSSLGKVRKGRLDDVIQTVQATIAEHLSTCSSVVEHAQNQFEDGIRGDAAANPLDRRAPRRLIHCQSMGVSSLVVDEDLQLDMDILPDDIRVFVDRRNHHEYMDGSFLGRSTLRENPETTAYREINGAADGFPGWTVDRYGDWLLVQHDEREYKGPLPSIHDGNTAGVYYLPASPDRSSMGATRDIRPKLLEGRAAPDDVPILENGVKYLVSMDKDLSTGIFLDQRPHRAWLTRHCNSETRVLNCFAHCGAFSIAAATAGASTVSMDLNKKWLDRIQPQLELNGIEFDERHDCIYGDCFEWLEKLAKRNEKFDIVILDPPSSSVGKKKRRWSVKNDMAELAALAGPLVKKGGLLWTTTNAATLTPLKYAKECKKGLDSVGLHGARLERVQPMPADFPTIGAQPVKNLVWRIR